MPPDPGTGPRMDLAGQPDRLRWNARYAAREATFAPHPLAVAALALLLPDQRLPDQPLPDQRLPDQPLPGRPLPDQPLPDRPLPGPPLPDLPVLELASGPSGSALLAAELGQRVTAVDVSDVGLDQLADEAGRRGLSSLLTVVQADVTTWTPAPACYGLVLCMGFWDATAFRGAVAAVAPGGLLAWEGLTAQARDRRPELPAAWCLGPGEPAALLPASFAVLEQEDLPGHGGLPRRRMLARNSAPRGG